MVQYDKLDAKNADIRLLRLLPGKKDAPICCTLRVVSLNKKPEFDALSYVWGDPTATKTISVDGEDFEATSNLEAALRALRSRHKLRTLWVDAICINQRDVAEKNSQVPLMSRIYQNATRVVPWLGPSNPSVDIAISYIEAFIEKRLTWRSSIWLKLRVAAAVSTKAKKRYILAVLQAAEGASLLLASPYWTRMWTFQEYYVPTKEPMCRRGSLEFKFRAETLVEVAERAMKLNDLVRRLDWEEDETARYERHYSSIGESHDTIPGSLAFTQSRFTDTEPVLSPYLALLLHQTYGRRCSDPRDKVFALYGALEPKARGLLPPPDYSKPISTVFLETTTYLINHERILPYDACELATAGSPSNNDKYPSWLLDFTSVLERPRLIHPSADTGAEAVSLQLPQVSADFKTLSISAKILGRISMLFPLEDTPFGVFQQLKTLVNVHTPQLENQSAGSERPDHAGRMILPSLAGLCFASYAYECEDSAAEILDTFRDVLGTLTALEPIDYGRPGTARFTLMSGVSKLAGKTLFSTERGRWGVHWWGRAPEAGDIIVLPAMNQPVLILRELLPITGEQCPYYEMIGVACIAGLLANFEPDEELLRDIEQIPLERFHIR
ncbi:heterokaryon incompatibility protein-domain-containing protein [Echria macrotheca]|uniref:Heterokaryon incompatibility protein-domain-containing protein n=1 Tax=Echria macrotheca TaxID=438768 RepID=A0AAJ0B6T3_9PEZI|nr:heterokaryon incompatibility protein-domain-containing protein [Echria macrotheca]